MKQVVLGVALVGTLLAGCAKKPENIAAVDVGANAYSSYSCRQLSETKLKYNQALANLSAQQRNAATGDALGVFLLGLPLASMSGSDQETQIAVTKGHIQTIELEESRKGCM